MTLVLEVPELPVRWWVGIGFAVWYLFAAAVVKLMRLPEDGNDWLPPPGMTWAFSPVLLPLAGVIYFIGFWLNSALAAKKNKKTT